MVLDTSPHQSPFEDEVKAGALEDRSIGHYIDSGVTGDSPDAVSNGINSGTQADGGTKPGDTIGKDLTIPHAVTDHVVTAPSDLPYQCTDPVVTTACARLAIIAGDVGDIEPSRSRKHRSKSRTLFLEIIVIYAWDYIHLIRLTQQLPMPLRAEIATPSSFGTSPIRPSTPQRQYTENFPAFS